METISKNVDGDTVSTNDGKVRVPYVDTPESVHQNERLNTQAGKEASKFAEDILPVGTAVSTADYGQDKYGRDLKGVQKNINGHDIDYGFVLLDQGYSSYNTRFGEHKDPNMHEEYKEYFSESSPYQYGDMHAPMAKEDYNAIADLQAEFSQTYADFQKGEASQEDLDLITADLYKDPKKVAHYRNHNKRWENPVNVPNNSDRAVMDWFFDNDENKALYNRAVRNGHLTSASMPHKDPTFWQSMKTSFSQWNSVANFADSSLLEHTRQTGENYAIPMEELTRGLPEQYHAAIQQEVDEHNETSAVVLRDQIIEDVKNNKDIDNMEWYAQFGYGAAAIILDPLTLIPAGKIYQTGKGIEQAAAKAWQFKGGQTGAKALGWTSMGMSEAAIQSFPRLDGDHTYTVNDYAMEIMISGAAAPLLGGAISGAGKYFKNRTEIADANKAAIRDIEEAMESGTPEQVVTATPEQVAARQKSTIADVKPIQRAGNEDASVSAGKVTSGINNWAQSGGVELLERSIVSTGILDSVGRTLVKLTGTKDIASQFLNSDNTVAKFFGSKVTEMGRGFGGNAKRAPTGGVIKHHEYKRSLSQFMPDYVRLVDDYAKSLGKTQYGRLQAAHQAGKTSKVVDKLNVDFMKYQEHKRLGKPTDNFHPSIKQMGESWDKYMDYNHGRLVDNKVAGFTANRKVKHYVPRVWQEGKMKGAINKYGEVRVKNLLSLAYQKGNHLEPLPQQQADEIAQTVIDSMKRNKGATVDDPYAPVTDARAQTRMDMDATTEVDGLSVMDLMDTEVAALATKYSQRASGWIGLSKSTDGVISNQVDIDTLKSAMIAESVAKGQDAGKLDLYYDDVINMMMGRPTREGLNPELREFKELAALTKMGGLGSAQLTEAGQAITRNMMNLFADPKVARRMIGDVSDAAEETRLLKEIASISNLTRDMEFLDRQSVRLDVNEMDAISKVREFSQNVADKATFGGIKAGAGRLLAKASGYNMVRRAQTRITKASFAQSVADHFVKGKSKMSPARMADVGLTNSKGVNDKLESTIKQHAEYDKDGILQALNFDKWSDSALESFQYAMARDEAQSIQQTLVGELPPWMNKPMMQVLMQFKQMSIVGQNKSMSRSLAFADKEATMGVLLNAAVAGLVRYSKFALLGAGAYALSGGTDDRVHTPITNEQMNVQQYMLPFGIFGDAYNVVSAGTREGANPSELLTGEVPVLGLLKDYMKAGDQISEGNIGMGLDTITSKLVPLSNLALSEMVGVAMQSAIEELPEVAEIFHGGAAIREVEKREGKLNSMERRIVEVEGFADGEYKDDKGVTTSGVGQTGDFANMTFKGTVKEHLKRTKNKVKNFDSLPKYLQNELVQANFRGDVGFKHKWVKSLNEGNFEAAAKELLNHAEYIERKSSGDDGVTRRLEDLRDALTKHAASKR